MIWVLGTMKVSHRFIFHFEKSTSKSKNFYWISYFDSTEEGIFMRIAKKNGLIKVTCFHPNKVSLCLVEIGWSLAKHNNCLLNQLHLPDVEQVVVLQVEHSQLWQINHQVAHLPQVILGKIQTMQMGQIDVILLYFLKASFKQIL